MTDIAAVVEAARNGRQEAWDSIVDTYAGLVWSVIRSCDFYAEEAADISQTVWLRCVEHLDRLRNPEHLAAWLATTARHECYKLSRRRGRSITVADVAEVADVTAEPIDMLRSIVLTHDIARVRDALGSIPPRCQILLTMLVTDPPTSYDDIVATLDIPKGSIGPTRARCLEHLRKALVAADE
jgi:RNA polymerase sigma factor (sigma-70 family)